MVRGVYCFETTEDGSKLVNIVYLKDNVVHNKVIEKTQLHYEIEDTLDRGYTDPETGEYLSIQNPEDFLEKLKNRFSGSYFYCQDVKDISEDELL